jgi:hypothetical protein
LPERFVPLVRLAEACSPLSAFPEPVERVLLYALSFERDYGEMAWDVLCERITERSLRRNEGRTRRTGGPPLDSATAILSRWLDSADKRAEFTAQGRRDGHAGTQRPARAGQAQARGTRREQLAAVGCDYDWHPGERLHPLAAKRQRESAGEAAAAASAGGGGTARDGGGAPPDASADGDVPVQQRA